jgi:bud site selection protein 20
MAGAQRRKGTKGKNKAFHRSIKTKHYGKDHDQIHQDIHEEHRFQNLEVDETKPGSGQHYCISCARFFESETTMELHKGTKKHKRMLKRMLEKPYTHEEAYEAGK